MDDREEQLANIARYQMFRYTIHWQNGIKDILEPNDVPLERGWNIMDLSNKAILCASNPMGVPMNKQTNDKLAKRMGEVLRKSNKKYNLVDRQALDQNTFQPVEDVSKAFFVHNINESEALKISNLFCAPFFLFFDYDPDFCIRIILSYPKSKKPLTGLYFSFEF